MNQNLMLLFYMLKCSKTALMSILFRIFDVMKKDRNHVIDNLFYFG